MGSVPLIGVGKPGQELDQGREILGEDAGVLQQLSLVREEEVERLEGQNCIVVCMSSHSTHDTTNDTTNDTHKGRVE
jgi:predicted GTPase